MQPDYILQADLLDIIFENKNKDYGAYPLRKFYQERLLKAMGISFSMIALISLAVFFTKSNINIPIGIVDPEYGKAYIIPEEPVTSPPAAPKPPVTVAHPAVTTAFQKPSVENTASNHIVFSVDAGKIADLIDPNEVTTLPVNQGQANTNTAGIPVPNKAIVSVIDKSIPLRVADVMPSFPGGIEALRKFLERNLSNQKIWEQAKPFQ